MEEQATFEARAVLGPRRTRRTRLALLLPAFALVALAWAGVSGGSPDKSSAEGPDQAADAAPSLGAAGSPSVTPAVPHPARPAEVFGLDVHRLDDLQPGAYDRDDILVITGWYAPKAITDCPHLDAIYRDGALPDVRGDTDVYAFCVRSGLLYASRPDLRENRFTERRAIPATFVIGVIAPLEIETVWADPREVVVIGRFVEGLPGCRALDGCRPELLIDHVAWTAGA